MILKKEKKAHIDGPRSESIIEKLLCQARPQKYGETHRRVHICIYNIFYKIHLLERNFQMKKISPYLFTYSYMQPLPVALWRTIALNKVPLQSFL